MEREEIKYLILFIIIVFLMFLVFIMSIMMNYYKRNKKYNDDLLLLRLKKDQEILQAQVEIQESTLSALSKELHDNIGQLLSSAKLLLGMTEREIPKPPQTLKIAGETIGKAISEVRLFSKSLNREWLQQFDLIQNLQTEINRINASKLITIDIKHTGILPMNSNDQIIIFRIIQELIQNCIKHACARHVQISLNTEGEHTVIKVIDDGCGFDIAGTKEGLGILNVKNRVSILCGSVEWLQNTQGSTVMIII